MIFTDRYKASGIPYPDPNTVCKGNCEGMGFYPEPKKRNNDGTIPVDTTWDFIKCEECGGTGKRRKRMSFKTICIFLGGYLLILGFFAWMVIKVAY
jgi:hypothetical protein